MQVPFAHFSTRSDSRAVHIAPKREPGRMDGWPIEPAPSLALRVSIRTPPSQLTMSAQFAVARLPTRAVAGLPTRAVAGFLTRPRAVAGLLTRPLFALR